MEKIFKFLLYSISIVLFISNMNCDILWDEVSGKTRKDEKKANECWLLCAIRPYIFNDTCMSNGYTSLDGTKICNPGDAACCESVASTTYSSSSCVLSVCSGGGL